MLPLASRHVADLLIHGDLLLASADAPPLPAGAVLIRDGAIAAVGDRTRCAASIRAPRSSAATACSSCPGSSTPTTTAWRSRPSSWAFPIPVRPRPGLRDTPFESWMATMLALDAVDPYLGTLAKDVLLLESGVTSHLHMHFPSGGGDGPPEDAYARELDDTLRAHRAAGQRVTLAPHWRDRSRLAYDGDDGFIAALPACPPGAGRARSRPPSMSNDAYIATIRGLVCELRDDPLLSAQFAIMAPQWASDELVAAVGSAAAELGAGIHLHSLESRLQRAWGDAFAGGRELERLERGRRALRSQRARARRLAARLRHRVPRPQRRYRRPQRLLEPAPRRRASHRCDASSRAASASRSGSTTWASPTTTTCSPRCAMAHTLQRVRGAAGDPRLAPPSCSAWSGTAARRPSVRAPPSAASSPGRRGDVVVVDLRALRAPCAARTRTSGSCSSRAARPRTSTAPSSTAAC